MTELLLQQAVVERRQAAGEMVRALDGVDLSIQAGEFVAVMGGTGAGKSTFALALAGLIDLQGGSVHGAGSRDVRLVLQRPESTFLASSVLEEVALGSRARGEPTGHAHRIAQIALAELGLPADVADRDPLALSGGEQRRVAIAAVLVTNPRVLVLDEPGAGLDVVARAALHDALARLHAAGRTIVLVTHDPAEAARLATRLVVLRGGRVAWDGGVAAVLGDPTLAVTLGIDVAPEVRALNAVARARGIDPGHVADTRLALDALARVLAGSSKAAWRGTDAATSPDDAPARRVLAPHPLPPLIDARARLLAAALAMAAALIAQTLLAATVVLLAAAVVVALARIERARVRLAVRPLLALTIMLVALQMLVGADSATQLTRERSSDAPALAALLRALQASAVVLVTLALSAATATTDLAAAMRRLLGPLRHLRVPVGSIAFVVATGLGLVPAFADDLERLRLAQRARGIRSRGAGFVAGARADAQLLAPLFVSAFRRAHLLADALAVRGIDPRRRTRSWRPRSTPASDVLLVLGGAMLVALSRFA